MPAQMLMHGNDNLHFTDARGRRIASFVAQHVARAAIGRGDDAARTSLWHHSPARLQHVVIAKRPGHRDQPEIMIDVTEAS